VDITEPAVRVIGKLGIAVHDKEYENVRADKENYSEKYSRDIEGEKEVYIAFTIFAKDAAFVEERNTD